MEVAILTDLSLKRLSALRSEVSGNNLAILNYVLERPTEAAFMKATDLGRKVGVSPSTVVRFAQRAGFGGYPEFQQFLQDVVRDRLIPMKKLRQSVQEMDERGDFLAKVIQLATESLAQVYSDSLKSSFAAATDAICSAERVYIVGMRSSYSIAYYLWFMLGQFMPNVHLVKSGTEDVFDQILDTGSGHVFVTISFPRYTKRTLDIAMYAKECGAKLIALTDTMASPLVPISDIALLTPNLSPIYSFVAPMVVADALVVAAGKRFKDRVQASLGKRETVLINKGIYV